MPYGEKFESALVYTAQLHRFQERKGSGVPYVNHLLVVASIVGENGGTEDEVVAAHVLGRVVQQGGEERLKDIRRRYGDAVANIVAGCTDTYEDPKPAWRRRKEAYVAHVAGAPRPVRLVSAADKLHNARSILADLRVLGEGLWERFTGGKEGTLWYYRALADEFKKDEKDPLADELDRIVGEIEALAKES